MRLFIIFTLFLFASVPAFAQTPVTQKMADAYYANCVKQEAELMSNKAQDLMCQCTAEQMSKTMSVEDIQAMGSEGPAARPAMNKMLTQVYAPCIEFPAYDYHYYSCVQNPDTLKLTNNPRPLCICLASEVADYLDKNGQAVFEDILKRNPDIYDPMDALVQDQKFQSFAQSRLLACVAKNK